MTDARYAAFESETPLFAPSDVQSTAVFSLLQRVNEKYGLRLTTYLDLYNWSISDIDKFWSLVWDETSILGHKGAHVVDKAAVSSSNPLWFADAKLNWAENMLVCRSEDKIALIQVSE